MVAFRPNGVSIERRLEFRLWMGSGVAGSERAIVGMGHSARRGGLQRQHLQRAGWTATEAFKKSEIPCRTGKASIVLEAWIGNSGEQRPCRNERELLNPSSGRSSKLGPPGGIGLPTILAHYDGDIAMFDVPPPLQSRGLAGYKKAWDLFFAYHQPGQAFDVEELQMCVGDTVTFAVAIMRCGQLPVSADHRALQGRRRLADPARAQFGAGDGLEEPERRAPAPLFRTLVSARNP
jgi:hypothetical protein